MKRITNLPEDVLEQILTRLGSAPETLSGAEMSFAKRIHKCCCCRHLWVSRDHRHPKRCPKCFTTQWNMATIRALADAHKATQPQRKGATTR
jgi:hypothetical protein